ncbi:MAG: cold shock domain-containing protein [Candidatus Poribacteria bacterium]|nr:cold shock domain-containing protein [Candidatus Poribacteria bacterium]
MPTGRIKYYNSDKGFGFIAQNSGEADVFLHVSAIEGVYDEVRVGQRIKYEIVKGNRGPVAQNAEIMLTPLEQKRLRQGKVVIPRDYTPPQNQIGDFETPPSPTPSQPAPAPSPASEPAKPRMDSSNVERAGSKSTESSPEKSTQSPPNQKASPQRASKPKASSKPDDRPTFGDLYIQKQIRLQTPMLFGLYNNTLLHATVSDFSKYNFVLQEGDETQELPKTDVKYCYKEEDAEKVKLLMRYNEEIKAQKFEPIVPRKQRYQIDNQAILQARQARYPIEVTMREGEIFRGLVDWMSRYEIKMILENGSKVVVFRHAICDFKAFPAEAQIEKEGQAGRTGRTTDEKSN